MIDKTKRYGIRFSILVWTPTRMSKLGLWKLCTTFHQSEYSYSPFGGKFMFLLVSVILSRGRGVWPIACWDIPPPEPKADPRTKSRHPPPPRTKGKHPRDQRQTPPGHTVRMRMRGRYTSYWNAYLFRNKNVCFYFDATNNKCLPVSWIIFPLVNEWLL